jgi:hypothetical protein
MGNTPSTTATPVPVSVTVIHPTPNKHPVSGYVDGNQYTLTYTLLEGQNNTVGGLLAAMGQHGPSNGTGVTGVSATAGEHPLLNDIPLVNGTTVYLSFVGGVHKAPASDWTARRWFDR